jgi:hypothetical protein
MTVRVYTNFDASAPALDGTTGSLVNLLDLCLVDGFGASTPLGWGKPFTGASMRVYRPPSGLRYYLDVDDAGPGAGTFKEARMRGYETMTALSTGTNLFPTVAQLANGLFIRKSVALDATPRNWYLIGDERTFYLAVQTGDTTNSYYEMSFGEIFSFKTTDLGRVFISGRATENSGTAVNENSDSFAASVASTTTGHYLARDTNGAVGAITMGQIQDGTLFSGAAGVIAFTNPADNLVMIPPIRIVHSALGNTVRGRYRGRWTFAHPLTSASDRDFYSGQDDLAGRQFIVLEQSANGGFLCYETSDTWDTN